MLFSMGCLHTELELGKARQVSVFSLFVESPCSKILTDYLRIFSVLLKSIGFS